jgi:hypothetical protein
MKSGSTSLKEIFGHVKENWEFLTTVANANGDNGFLCDYLKPSLIKIPCTINHKCTIADGRSMNIKQGLFASVSSPRNK